MAGLNIAERRQPQDGRIRTAVDGGTLDIRVATAPTLHGESLVLRLLHRDRTALELPKLGFGGSGLQRLQLALERPHGMVLVTGPQAAARPPRSMLPSASSIASTGRSSPSRIPSSTRSPGSIRSRSIRSSA